MLSVRRLQSHRSFLRSLNVSNLVTIAEAKQMPKYYNTLPNDMLVTMVGRICISAFIDIAVKLNVSGSSR